MSDTIVSLRRKIGSAGDLQSVVHTMKALAASNIEQYEQAVRSLSDYYRTVEMGLCALFRDRAMLPLAAPAERTSRGESADAVVFGSDQGLVGQFNDSVADFAVEALRASPGEHHVWAVGERVYARLADVHVRLMGCFAVPNGVKAITPLIGQILLATEGSARRAERAPLHLFYNRPRPETICEPTTRRLLPLDAGWCARYSEQHWPSSQVPEVVGGQTDVLRALIGEYVFVSLYQACAESLSSENASRLAAMQRAEKNIDELLEELTRTYHRIRQSNIDEELFDVISGYEVAAKPTHPAQTAV